MIDAADDAGSKDATLDLIEGRETLESDLKGHRGGDPGDVGLLNSSLILVGLFAIGVCTGVDCSLESGDRFSDILRSLPLPNTVFLKDPFLFRLL